MRGREGAGMATHTATLVRMNRWVILAGHALLTACTQLLWLAYAPITTQTHHAMNVSSAAVGDLAIIFPVMYVILALPAGRWLDARFGQALGLGAVLTAGGGLLRLAGPSSYGWALAGQFVIAAGQPFVLNSITKVAARYFPARERTAAISAGSVALFVGILAAVLSGGPLFDAGGLALLLWVQAAVAVLAAVWVLPAVAFAVMTVVHSPAVGGVVRFVAGFFLLAGLPVVLDWSELHAGPERAGGAAGFLLLAGNLGGVILALIVQAVIGNPYLSLGGLRLARLAGPAPAPRLPAQRARA